MILSFALIWQNVFVAQPVEAAVGYRASASNTSSGTTQITINKPTGTAQNDAMVALIAIGTDTGMNTPSGWTFLQVHNTVAMLKSLYYKIAGASEPADYTFTWDTNTRVAGGISSYTGINTTSVVDVIGGGQNNNGTSVTASSISPLYRGDLLIDAYATTSALASSFTSPGGMTERLDEVSPAGILPP